MSVHQPSTSRGGGSHESMDYDIDMGRTYDAKKFKLKGTDYKIKLTKSSGKTYKEVHNQFLNTMNDIVDVTLGTAEPHDRVRFAIKNSELDRNLNTSYIRRDQIDGEWLFGLFSKLLQSYEDLDLSNFTLHVQHVALPNGNGMKKYINLIMHIAKKGCVVTKITQYDDIPCFGYALMISIMLTDLHIDAVRAFCTNKSDVIEQVTELFESAQVPYGPVNIEQYDKFQSSLPDDLRLIILDAHSHGELLYKGNRPKESTNVILLFCDDHYLTLRSIPAYFCVHYYCIECEVKISDKRKHVCKHERKCVLCLEKSCLYKPSTNVFCNRCMGIFRNNSCYWNHRKSVCDSANVCGNCFKWFPMNDIPKHDCNVLVCTYCKKVDDKNHRCYIDTVKEERDSKFRLVFYDFECTQNDIDPESNRLIHRVNYCICMCICDKCVNGPCDRCSEVKTFSGLDKDDALYNFCVWALDDSVNENTKFIAHNSSGYDTHFILSYIVNQGRSYPEIVTNGGKILKLGIKSKNIEFIDSFLFLSMPLSKFSDTFNLPNITKGTFPHLFNVPDNYNYNGPLPDLVYYGVDNMKEPSRSALIKWHTEHNHDNFNFRLEMHDYCKADVQLLKAGCMQFRDAFMKDTGVDPYNYFTIAGACMEVFRTNFLKENTIARIPINGYRSTRNYSNKAMGWLQHIEQTMHIKLRHARNGGEVYLNDAKVWADGYYEDYNGKHVFAFMGCFFHGCNKCYTLSTRNPRLKQSMGDLYRNTQRWIETVNIFKYHLTVMWECQWDSYLECHPDDKEIINALGISSPLDPRDALYGGRCETFCLHAVGKEVDQIKYCDVQSLYPYVCKIGRYPVGHAECITGIDLQNMGTDVKQFFGIIKCNVTPPRGLFIPLLPFHINNKLQFVLCKSCAESNTPMPCTHSDKKRSFTGTWASPELHKAVDIGYTVNIIFEVWQYDQSSVYNGKTDGLFTDYMNTFMRLKMEASGYPSYCKTEEEKHKYIKRVEIHEGITLNPLDIEYNAGRRAVAKICLNNLWGKLSQNPDLSQKEFITDPKKFFNLIIDDAYEISDVQPVNDNCIFATYKQSNAFLKPSKNTNVVIAAFVTTYARLELYSHLEGLGDRSLYCDTDSVIYRHAPGQFEPEISEFLGGMTDELGGNYIVEYISNGPKNYAYRTSDGQQIVKIKGFTLNHLTSQQITFDAMRDMAISRNDIQIKVVEKRKIKKDLKRRQVITIDFNKTYQRVFDKRVRNPNTHTSLPFGF